MTAGIIEPLATSVPAFSSRGKAEQLVQQMEYAREPHMPRFRDLQDFVAPYSANVDNLPRPYEGDAPDVLDETVFFCRTTLASFFASAMTNPSRQWRQWTLTDPDLAEAQAVKDWLHTTNDRSMVILSRSNFYDAMAWVYEEWPTFATAVVLIEEDEVDVVRYVPFGIGSYALADNEKGECNAVSRRFRMTIRQMVERFCTDADGNVDLTPLSIGARQMVKDGMWGTQVEICHLVCPNDEYSPAKDTPESFAYASYYWEWGSEVTSGYGGFLAKEGYREWPFMVFRWKRMHGTPWGVDAPGISTLGANKTLQQMESDLLMAVEKQVKPPLVVPTELTNASLLPAAKNSVNTRSGQAIGALHETNPAAIQIIAEVQQTRREMIMSLWWTRLVLALTGTDAGRERTAREIEEISSEKFLVLGRVVESAGSAFRMASDREFAIMYRRGLLPEIPPELEGQPLTVEYTSLLAVAQKSVGLGSLERYGMQMAEMFRLTQDPDLMLKTDWAQWADEVGLRSAIPPRVQRTDEEVAKIRQAQAEQMAQQQRVEQAAVEARAAKDLSQADTSGDNALTRLVNGAVQ